jgi:hypothetical protein
MRTLADALAFCAQPADDLDHLFHARQWFKLQSAFTDRSPSLMRAAVATAFNDPETAKPPARRDQVGADFERRGRGVRPRSQMDVRSGRPRATCA